MYLPSLAKAKQHRENARRHHADDEKRPQIHTLGDMTSTKIELLKIQERVQIGKPYDVDQLT